MCLFQHTLITPCLPVLIPTHLIQDLLESQQEVSSFSLLDRPLLLQISGLALLDVSASWSVVSMDLAQAGAGGGEGVHREEVESLIEATLL